MHESGPGKSQSYTLACSLTPHACMHGSALLSLRMIMYWLQGEGSFEVYGGWRTNEWPDKCRGDKVGTEQGGFDYLRMANPRA